MSVNSAIINFNEGTHGVIDVLKNLGIRIGRFTHIGLINRDKCRIRKCTIKSSLTAKTRRQKLRHQKKGFNDKEAQLEPCQAYSAGFY